MYKKYVKKTYNMHINATPSLLQKCNGKHFSGRCRIYVIEELTTLKKKGLIDLKHKLKKISKPN